MTTNNNNSTFPYRELTITLLSGVCNETGDVTTAHALTEQERSFLLGATQNINGYCLLQLQATGVSGSGTPVPTVTITGVEYSLDGTNYAQLQSVALAPVISGTGTTGTIWISSPLNVNTTHIRLAASAAVLTADDLVTIIAKLVCTVAHG